MTAIATHDAARREILTPAEVADRLRVSRETVRRLVVQGKLPAARVGTRLRFHADDVDRLLEPIEARS